MERVFVSGLGAVSPAGWGVQPLMDALRTGAPLPAKPLARPEPGKAVPPRPLPPLLVRPVPPPVPRPEFFVHPRFRRVSPLAQYGAAAALEASAALPQEVRGSGLGLIFCLQIGPVQYASRFLQEVVADPATASPLLFPETVFSAPASHVAALLGQPVIAYTLMGDPGAFLEGMAIAAEWLNEQRASACLVIGAEEFNWLQADAAQHFDRRGVFGPGAAAVCLSREPAWSLGVELESITDVHTYSVNLSQAAAARAMRSQLPAGAPDELLCDGIGGAPRPAAAERNAWLDWPGARLSPKNVLGEGFMAAAGWQCVAAARAVSERSHRAAHVSLVGCNQQAIGARFKASS